MRNPILGSSPYETEPVNWLYHADGRQIDVTTSVLTSDLLFEESETEPVDHIILFAGYGEGAWAIGQGLKTLHELGIHAVAPILNADAIPPEEIFIEGFMKNVGQVTTSALQERRKDLPKKVTALGHSLGVLTVGEAVRQGADFGDLALLEGVSTNNRQLLEQFSEDDDRFEEFTKRFIKVLLGPYIVSPYALAGAGHDLSSQIGRDLWPLSEHRYANQMRTAIKPSMDPSQALLRHAAAGNKVLHVLGDRDPLIVPQEVYKSLQAHAKDMGLDWTELFGNQLLIHTTKEKHAYMAFPAGARHMQVAADTLGIGRVS
jgi:hypothetical protein